MAAAVVLLHPAVIDVSAWWGQYESIYLLSALAAVAVRRERAQRAGRRGHRGLPHDEAAGAPVHPPVRGLVLGARRMREIVRTAAIGLAVIVVLWLPFIPAGGPLNYLQNLAEYQNTIFPILSLHAWNIWWLVQVAAAGGFAGDQVAVIGPITLRHLGFVITGLLSLVVAARILRDPRPRTFILGLAASTLIWYEFLTQMHERYAYGALIFLLLLIPERRIQWLYLAFGVLFTLDLWSAAPPAPIFREWLPFAGIHSIIGSVAMIAITWLTVSWMVSRPRADRATPDHRVAVDGAVR